MRTSLALIDPQSSPDLDHMPQISIPQRLIELFNMVRKQMEHEDDLINHRINWLLVSQGFLFLAFAQIFAGTIKTAYQSLVLGTIASVGILICGLTFFSVWGAIHAIAKLRKFWEGGNPYPDLTPSEKQERSLLPPISYRGGLDRAEVAAYGIPGVMGIAWIVLLAATIIHYLGVI